MEGRHILTGAAFFREPDNYLSDNVALTGIMLKMNHAEASGNARVVRLRTRLPFGTAEPRLSPYISYSVTFSF